MKRDSILLVMNKMQEREEMQLQLTKYLLPLNWQKMKK